MPTGKRPAPQVPFQVTIALPERTIGVYAKDEADAAWKVWNMIGQAGVKEFGRLDAVRTTDFMLPPDSPPARRV